MFLLFFDNYILEADMTPYPTNLLAAWVILLLLSEHLRECREKQHLLHTTAATAAIWNVNNRVRPLVFIG